MSSKKESFFTKKVFVLIAKCCKLFNKIEKYFINKTKINEIRDLICKISFLIDLIYQHQIHNITSLCNNFKLLLEFSIHFLRDTFQINVDQNNITFIESYFYKNQISSIQSNSNFANILYKKSKEIQSIPKSKVFQKMEEFIDKRYDQQNITLNNCIFY